MNNKNNLIAQALAFEISRGAKVKPLDLPALDDAPVRVLIKPNRPARQSRLINSTSR